jgi:hypothetical protein
MFSGNYSWNGDIFTKDLSNGTTSKTNDKGTMKIIKINDTFYDVEIIGDGYKIETIFTFNVNKCNLIGNFNEFDTSMFYYTNGMLRQKFIENNTKIIRYGDFKLNKIS